MKQKLKGGAPPPAGAPPPTPSQGHEQARRNLVLELNKLILIPPDELPIDLRKKHREFIKAAHALLLDTNATSPAVLATLYKARELTTQADEVAKAREVAEKAEKEEAAQEEATPDRMLQVDLDVATEWEDLSPEEQAAFIKEGEAEGLGVVDD